jgi:hypothetical protein
MNKITLLFLLSVNAVCAFAQESTEKVMELRAREMMRIISIDDKSQWKKFIKENFTQAFIDKNMNAKVQTSDSNEGGSTETTQSADNLEAKADMFVRLHEDFGAGKISSLKITGEKLEMVVMDSGLKGTFRLTFEKTQPFRIDGMGIEAGN